MRALAILLLSLIICTCNGQSPMKSLLDSVIWKVRETSLYSSKIDWDALQSKVYIEAENATSLSELKPAFEMLLNGMKDFHGRILNANTYAPIAYFTDYEHLNHPDQRPRDPIVQTALNNPELKFEYELLPEAVGYLKITGISPMADVEKEALKIREAIEILSKKKIDKWIIDLRYNSGGNMNPMMAGLAPLIGDGIVGKLIKLNGDTLFNWEIKEGNFTYGGYEARLTLPNNITFKNSPKIAVLTSRYTVSSGELVATSLKGRPNTKFFGEATGSFTTNNGWGIINNEVILCISTGLYCDRNGNAYPVNIPVDVEAPFVMDAEAAKDECIQKAVEWLVMK